MGRVLRPHGLHGETVVSLVSNRPERVVAGSVFDTAGGPLRLVQVRPFGSRWLMHFDDVTTREAAEELRGVVLRARALEDDQVLWVHELVGAEAVRASDGSRVGRVVAVVSNPASDLLELEDGALVPMRFVVGTDRGRVELDLPAGLLDG